MLFTESESVEVERIIGVCVAAIVAVCISGANSISAVKIVTEPVVGIIWSRMKNWIAAKIKVATIITIKRIFPQLNDLFLLN